MKLIGHSLSLCVKDVIHGIVEAKHIEFINTNTRVTQPGSWAGLIREYQRTYWERDPSAAALLTWCLLSTGKIVQPRIFVGDSFIGPTARGYHWSDLDGNPVRPQDFARKKP